MDRLVVDNRENILSLAKKNGVINVRVFGSMTCGNAGVDSDVDFLVDIAEGKSGFALGGFLIDVSEILHRKIDVVTEKSLHRKIYGKVIREAVRL